MSKVIARIILAFLVIAGLVALAIFAPEALIALGIVVGAATGTFILLWLLAIAFPVNDDWPWF